MLKWNLNPSKNVVSLAHTCVTADYFKRGKLLKLKLPFITTGALGFASCWFQEIQPASWLTAGRKPDCPGALPGSAVNGACYWNSCAVISSTVYWRKIILCTVTAHIIDLPRIDPLIPVVPKWSLPVFLFAHKKMSYLGWQIKISLLLQLCWRLNDMVT